MKSEKILIAGDFYPTCRIAELINKNDFDTIFSPVMKYFQSVDCAILNLEAPILPFENVNTFLPIEKSGPNMKCNPNTIKALKYLGIDIVTLANNHILDYGDKAVKNTLNLLKDNEIDFVGAGKNIDEANQTKYIKIGNKTIALINCCEHEFCIATETSAGANPLNVMKQYYVIQEAKKVADIVMIIVHGGHEYYQLPSPRMKETYRFFVDVGADVVINGHQHCYSGYEIYKEKPIVYGLGNFCFDSTLRNKNWNLGYFVILTISNNEINIQPIGYHQCNDSPSINVLSGSDALNFTKSLQTLNEIIADDTKLHKAFEEFSISVKDRIFNTFISYHNRYLNAAAQRKWIKRPFSKKELPVILNHLTCQSHKDVAEKVLELLFSDKISL